MASIDLSPYGLFWELDPSKMSFPVPQGYSIAGAKFNRNDGNLDLFGQTGNQLMKMKLGNMLGRGSYGATYMTDRTYDGNKFVVKIIQRRAEYTTAAVAVEVISQILVVKNTEGFNDPLTGLKGPLAPRLYYFAKDDSNYYIVNELMSSSFNDIIEKTDYAQNLSVSITQIAVAMKTLFDLLQFNHRDFKPDNIMFNSNSMVRIIDFGFSCLTYGGMKINSGYPFPHSELHSCESKSRDMNAMFFYFLNYSRYKNMSCPVKRVIRALMFNKSGDPLDWANSYKKYNRRPELVNMMPETLIKVFSALKFNEIRGCSDFDPSWVKEVPEINLGFLSNIKNEEVAHLDKNRLMAFLSTAHSPSITKRVLTVTKDPEIEAFCHSILQNMGTKKTDGGSKRVKRQSRQKWAKGKKTLSSRQR